MSTKTQTPFEKAAEDHFSKKESPEGKKFHAGMTAGEVLRTHPESGVVLASYHLGGCSHCGINEEHRLEDICTGYGVPLDALLDSLNSLLED